MRSIVSLLAFATAITACGGKTGDPGPSNPPESSTLPAPTAGATADPTPTQPAAPAAETIAQDVGEPSALALDGETAVFTTRRTMVSGELTDAGAVYVKDKRVGAALLIALDRQGASYETLATDGTSAFVAASDGRILRVPLAGGDDAVITTFGGAATALTTSGDYVYFAGSLGTVGRVAKTGGTPELLGTAPGAVRALSADDKAVYAASSVPGLFRIDLASKEATTVAAGAGEPCAIARTGSGLFFTSAKTAGIGAVLRLPLDGAGDVATVASGAFAACGIAADAASLYFATSAPGTAPGAMAVRSAKGIGLMRAPIAGGDPVAIAGATGALAQPGAVAVDDTHVYWLTSTAVLRLRK